MNGKIKKYFYVLEVDEDIMSRSLFSPPVFRKLKYEDCPYIMERLHELSKTPDGDYYPNEDISRDKKKYSQEDIDNDSYQEDIDDEEDGDLDRDVKEAIKFANSAQSSVKITNIQVNKDELNGVFAALEGKDLTKNKECYNIEIKEDNKINIKKKKNYRHDKHCQKCGRFMDKSREGYCHVCDPWDEIY